MRPRFFGGNVPRLPSLILIRQTGSRFNFTNLVFRCLAKLGELKPHKAGTCVAHLGVDYHDLFFLQLGPLDYRISKGCKL